MLCYEYVIGGDGRCLARCLHRLSIALLTISISIRGSSSLPSLKIMHRAWAEIDLIFPGMKSDFRVLVDGLAEELLKAEILGRSGTGRKVVARSLVP